jgi:hypothetical protein
MTYQVGSNAGGDESFPLFMNRAFVLWKGRWYPLATEFVRVPRIVYIPSPFLPPPIIHYCHIQQPSRASCLYLSFTLEAFPWSHSSHNLSSSRSEIVPNSGQPFPQGSGSDMPKLTSHQQRFSRIVLSLQDTHNKDPQA